MRRFRSRVGEGRERRDHPLCRWRMILGGDIVIAMRCRLRRGWRFGLLGKGGAGAGRRLEN